MTTSSPKAISFLAAQECPGGVPPLHPYWPKNNIQSGVTIGVGEDLGQLTPAAFTTRWTGQLPEDTINALIPACGVRGIGAGQLVQGSLGALVIPVEASETVFALHTLPQYEQELRDSMPGADALPPDAFGALTDLVYNRGPSLAGDRRLEMRKIAQAVVSYGATTLNSGRAAILRAMVEQLTQMADRLWPVPSDDVWNTILHRRRLGEAAMIAGVATTLDPETP